MTFGGGVIYVYSGDYSTWAEDCEEAKISILCTVPKFTYYIYRVVMRKMEENAGVGTYIVGKAFTSSYKRLNDHNDFKDNMFYNKIMETIANRMFHGRLRAFISGVAPVTKTIKDFF